MKMKLASALLISAAFAIPAAAEHHGHGKMEAKAGGLEGVDELIAVIQSANGTDVEGSALFQEVEDGVKITIEVGGLTPGGVHAIHIHEFGNIIEKDGSSAGGHYNPEGHPHGLPETAERHAGDLGNLEADQDGNAKKEISVGNITLTGPENPVIGRAVIIHAQPDDGGQPTGNAGDRIGMGVIGVSRLAEPQEAEKPEAGDE